MTETLIEVEGLTKTFSDRWRRRDVCAVRDLNLTVARWSVVAFVGPNGAGKTTTIFALLGFLLPEKGRVQVFGAPPGSMEARRRTGFQSEIFYTYGFKTATKALRFYGELSGVARSTLDGAVERQLARLGLGAAAHRNISGFSKGMVQRLGLAQALLHEPELLILDEPTTGLDPEGRKLVADIILEEKRRGTTILLSSHILSDVELTCDHIVILRNGGVVLSEKITRLRADADTWEIEVSSWTPAAREALAGTEVRPSSAGLDVVRCGAGQKHDLLLRLIQAGAQVGAVRQARTLEDIYMSHVEPPVL
jgi:ABC-2 type transport system ATP-binding protein